MSKYSSNLKAPAPIERSTECPRGIGAVLMECPDCPWEGPVIDCDCDSDFEGVKDDGRLRCPVCGAVVNQKPEKEDKLIRVLGIVVTIIIILLFLLLGALLIVSDMKEPL